MKRFLLLLLLLIPIVHAQDIHPMSTLVIITTAEEYNIEDMPITVTSSGFNEYCNLCERDVQCCEYCEVECISTIINTSSKSGLAESLANLKFKENYKIEKGTVCPKLEVKKEDPCVDFNSIDLDYDSVYYKIDEINYTSEKYLWKDIHDKENYRFTIDHDFKIKQEDKLLLEEAVQAKQKDIENLVLKFEEIKDILEVDETNETLGRDQKGVIVLTEKSKFFLKRSIIFSTIPIYLSIIILILLIISIIILLKRGKK